MKALLAGLVLSLSGCLFQNERISRDHAILCLDRVCRDSVIDGKAVDVCQIADSCIIYR